MARCGCEGDGQASTLPWAVAQKACPEDTEIYAALPWLRDAAVTEIVVDQRISEAAAIAEILTLLPWLAEAIPRPGTASKRDVGASDWSKG